MRRLDIKVGFSCNNCCLHCVQGDKRKKIADKTTEVIKKELKAARGECQNVVFTGGEPTIRKDFLELVQCAHQLGYKEIQIQSNGRMFAYPKIVKATIEAGATEFAIAVLGHTDTLHDYLTGVKGSFAQTIQGIINLKKYNQYILTNTVITRSNYRNLEQIAHLLVGLGVNQYQFAFVHALGNARENFMAIVPRKTMVMPYVKRGLKVGIKVGKKVMTEAIPYCFMEGYQDYIAEKIIPLTTVYDYDKIIDFSQVRQEEGKLKREKCKSCCYYTICEGPWKEYPEHFGWSEFVPVKAKIAQDKGITFIGAVKDIFCTIIENRGLSHQKVLLGKMQDILFSDFDEQWLTKNQKFDISFSQSSGLEQTRAIRFSYNNFEEKITYREKFIRIFELFKDVYPLQKINDLLVFMDTTYGAHQTTLGVEWFPHQQFPRLKIYFEELFSYYSKNKVRSMLSKIYSMFHIKGRGKDNSSDTIGALSIDFVPEQSIDVKIYYLYKRITEKIIRDILGKYAIEDKTALLRNFLNISMGSQKQFHYITQRISQKGEINSVKLYNIYEVMQIESFNKVFLAIENFLKTNSFTHLLKDVELIKNMASSCKIDIYPVIIALDIARHNSKVDVYWGFRPL